MIHVFGNDEIELQAMRPCLQAPLKPLLEPQPAVFFDPALAPEKADHMRHLHEVALDAQSDDSS